MQQKVFLAGPSDGGKYNIMCYGELGDMSYDQYISEIADVLVESAGTVGFVIDDGLPLDIVRKVTCCTTSGHRPHRIGFYPKQCPNRENNAEKYAEFCDEVVLLDGGWLVTNTQPSKDFDILLCCGLSAGVLTEISYVKTHHLYSGSHVQVVIDWRTISQPLPRELESDLERYPDHSRRHAGIQYVNNRHQLKRAILRYQ